MIASGRDAWKANREEQAQSRKICLAGAELG